MNRSLSLFLAALVSAAPLASAQENLDSLLGDWADAAANEPGQPSNSGSDLTLAPASEDLRTLDSMHGEPINRFESNPPSVETERPVRMPASDGSTLTGTHTGEALGHQPMAHVHSGMHPVPDPEMYSVAVPQANPYVASADCGCQPQSCDGPCESECAGPSSCGGGCELVGRCETGCREGKSECRPHQTPNLPSSTFLDLFRSRNSYSNVWAGYAEETRLRVRNLSPHLDGTWKCQGCGAMLEPNQVGCSCGSSCDGCP